MDATFAERKATLALFAFIPSEEVRTSGQSGFGTIIRNVLSQIFVLFRATDQMIKCFLLPKLTFFSEFLINFKRRKLHP